MSEKKQHREQIERLMALQGIQPKVLPTGYNLEFDAYLRDMARNAGFSRFGSSSPKRSRSPFFRRGAGGPV